MQAMLQAIPQSQLQADVAMSHIWSRFLAMQGTQVQGAADVKAADTKAQSSKKKTEATKTGPGSGLAAQPSIADIEPLPSFKDTPAGERQALFIRKLKLCATQVDFSIENVQNKDNAQKKEIKRLNLLEIMDYINTTKGVFNETTFDDITAMISANLFRGLGPTTSTNPTGEEEEEPTLEPAWPHLQYVYEFLLRFVVSNETDPKLVRRHISQEFLVKLLDLFDSEDPRERDYLKTILHRIYGKFMPYRGYIRKTINAIFYRFIYETERHNGIAELLEILGMYVCSCCLRRSVRIWLNCVDQIHPIAVHRLDYQRICFAPQGRA